MTMKAGEAELAGQGYLELWGFPGTYCLAKHLAEKLVADYHCKRWAGKASSRCLRHSARRVCCVRQTLCLAVAHASARCRCRGLACAIVRPSIIGSVNGDPYPGYTGNLAGVSGEGGRAAGEPGGRARGAQLCWPHCIADQHE
jgi:hypothetical protein